MVGGIIAAVVVALLGGGIGGAKIQEKRQKVELHPTPLPVELVKTLATKEDLGEVEEKLEGRIGRVEQAATEDRRILRSMEGKTHERIDKVAEALARQQGTIEQINANVERLIERQMKGGPRG